MASLHKNLDSRIAHRPGVKGAVHAEGREIAARAKGRLAAHRFTKDDHGAEIEFTIQDTDVVVSLVDPAALSIEFGHFTDNGEVDAEVTYVPGLNIITGSI